MSFRAVETILKAVGSNFLSLGERGFDYGPQGRLLRRNVESLWFQHCVTMPPYNVFLSSAEKLSETLETLRDSRSDSKPFGIATTEDSRSQWNDTFFPEYCKTFSHKIAKVSVVTDAATGKDMFHRKQRERKVWWRKFARNPSRFALTEARKVSKNRETIDIAAKFEFGDVILETIIYMQDAKKIYSQMANEKDDPPGVHAVEHIASLDWGCLAMLCDGFEPAGDSCELKIHPKLSPYKAGFYLERPEDDSDDPKSQEKTRLILYLNNVLKAQGLETVLTRSKSGIDAFHVPLTITVDDASLRNGIIRVTSQLTTIAEAVHVVDLPKYVAARCA